MDARRSLVPLLPAASTFEVSVLSHTPRPELVVAWVACLARRRRLPRCRACGGGPGHGISNALVPCEACRDTRHEWAVIDKTLRDIGGEPDVAYQHATATIYVRGGSGPLDKLSHTLELFDVSVARTISGRDDSYVCATGSFFAWRLVVRSFGGGGSRDPIVGEISRKLRAVSPLCFEVSR